MSGYASMVPIPSAIDFAATPVEIVTGKISDQFLISDRQRRRQIARNWQAYYGQHPASLDQQYEPGRSTVPPNDNVVVNMCRVIVDTGTRYLWGDDWSADTDSARSTNISESASFDIDALTVPEPENVFLNAFMRQQLGDGSEGESVWSLMSLNAAVAGHGFVKLGAARPMPVTEPDGSAGMMSIPTLEVWDSGDTKVVTNPDDYKDVWEYRHTWVAAEDEHGNVQGMRQRVIKLAPHDPKSHWKIVMEKGAWTSEVETMDEADWTPVGKATHWPYSWSPVHACQNLPNANEYWGQPDLTQDVLFLQYALNRVASNIHKIIRLHGGPHFVGRGIGDGVTIDLAPETLTRLPDPEADISALVWQNDLPSSLVWYEKLKAAIHEVACIPEVATGNIQNIGQLQSALAIKILFAPLVKKIQDKRRTQGPCARLLCEHALELGGFSRRSVQIHWPELVPQDPVAEAQSLQFDSTQGVSSDTIMRKRGYDPRLERWKKRGEARSEAALNAELGQAAASAPDASQGAPTLNPPASPPGHGPVTGNHEL